MQSRRAFASSRPRISIGAEDAVDERASASPRRFTTRTSASRAAASASPVACARWRANAMVERGRPWCVPDQSHRRRRRHARRARLHTDMKDGDVATWYVGVLDGREVTKPGVRFTGAARGLVVRDRGEGRTRCAGVCKPDVPRRRARGRRTTRASGTGCAIRRSTSRRVSTVGIAARRRARVTRAAPSRGGCCARRSRRRSRHGDAGLKHAWATWLRSPPRGRRPRGRW